jgi:hypothetical protein
MAKPDGPLTTSAVRRANGKDLRRLKDAVRRANGKELRRLKEILEAPTPDPG